MYVKRQSTSTAAHGNRKFRITMVTIPLNRKRDSVLNEFAKEYRDRTLSYLHGTFSLGIEDSEDVFQDALLILCEDSGKGKLDHLTSSLYTYFTGICKNKAHEKLRANGKAQISLIDDYSNEENEQRYNGIINKADRILSLFEVEEKEALERNRIVEDMVRGLPSPCNKLLWSFYRDALSMKAIAQMFNYASESVAKVTKHRCQERFREKYEGIINKL